MHVFAYHTDLHDDLWPVFIGVCRLAVERITHRYEHGYALFGGAQGFKDGLKDQRAMFLEDLFENGPNFQRGVSEGFGFPAGVGAGTWGELMLTQPRSFALGTLRRVLKVGQSRRS